MDSFVLLLWIEHEKVIYLMIIVIHQEPLEEPLLFDKNDPEVDQSSLPTIRNFQSLKWIHFGKTAKLKMNLVDFEDVAKDK